MKFTLRKDGEDRGWPNYLPGGRVRTSTAGLLIAFCATWWLYETYQPPPPPPAVPAQQVVPPGFVPDPAYTWVPRTYVQPPKTTTPTTETTETSTTETSPAPGDGLAPTTVIDPDGPGPLTPQTITGTPTTSSTETPLPLPNRSGQPTSTTAIVGPSVGESTPATSVPPR